jgi:hypothetical protein
MRPGGAWMSAAVIFAFGAAHAHDAPVGWTYDSSCCSGIDCRVVNHHGGVRISETPQGYRISTTGEVLNYRDSRIKVSPDGDYHWCSAGGRDTGRTICLYAPPKGF